MSETTAPLQTTPSPESPIIAMYSREAYPALCVIDSVAAYENTPINTLIIAGLSSSSQYFAYNYHKYFPMFDLNGNYVGDPNWFESLSQLKRATNITKIFISLGDSLITTLAQMEPTALANFMSCIQSNNVDGIDLDAESVLPTDESVYTVSKAAIKAGLELTGAPAANQEDWATWCQYVSNHNSKVSWLNLQCYSGGSGNNPAEWAASFANLQVPIVAGMEATPGDPKDGPLNPFGVERQLSVWQKPQPSLGGAFIWNYGDVEFNNPSYAYPVYLFAQAMASGLAEE